MKYIIILLVFFSMTTKAQEGVTISFEQEILMDYVPEGTYIKELNNNFDFLIGTWEGIWDNKKISLVLSKMEKVMRGTPPHYIYRDVIVGKYTLTDLSTNTIVLNTMNAVNYNDFQIEGIGCPLNDQKYLIFIYNSKAPCNMSFQFALIKLSSNQLTYKFAIHEGYYPDADCNYNDTNYEEIPSPFPLNSQITLTKQ